MTQVPDGWIDGTLLALPTQTLERGDVAGFLQFLFAEISKRPGGFTLRETAGVVRYLRLLAAQGVPVSVLTGGNEALRDFKLIGRGHTETDRVGRLSLDRLVKIIWGDLLNQGVFRHSTRWAALAFLRDHADDYQMSPELKPAMEFVQGYDLPPDFVNSDRPASLKSAHRSVHSNVKTRQQDDLSERVFAAYYALPRAGIMKRSRIIAEALAAARVGTGRKSAGVRTDWSWDDVNDRVKSYERTYARSQRRLLAQAVNRRSIENAVKGALTLHREQCANSWIAAYKFSMTVPLKR